MADRERALEIRSRLVEPLHADLIGPLMWPDHSAVGARRIVGPVSRRPGKTSDSHEQRELF